MIETRPAEATTTRAAMPSAVAYIDDEHAIVVKNLPDASIGVIDIPCRKPEDLSYLVRIVDEIGPRRRVAILGPDRLRLELEREYVTLYRRPDLLVDVEESDGETAAHLIDRLEELSS
ncbi:MAG TPA: hypothetical protein VFS32_04140 [Candidatus Limnocylindrales bacterium]|nr:hypothetical protein [Candidatus Limnocylindrales bacterium]